MKEVIHLTGQVILIPLADTQQFFVDIALDGHQTIGIHTQATAQSVQLVFRAGANQGKYPAVLALEQATNQKTTNKAGGTGDEVVHCFPLLLPCCSL